MSGGGSIRMPHVPQVGDNTFKLGVLITLALAVIIGLAIFVLGYALPAYNSWEAQRQAQAAAVAAEKAEAALHAEVPAEVRAKILESLKKSSPIGPYPVDPDQISIRYNGSMEKIIMEGELYGIGYQSDMPLTASADGKYRGSLTFAKSDTGWHEYW